MVTKLAELAIVVSLITLSQRLIGYENKPLGFLLLFVALLASIIWIYQSINDFQKRRQSLTSGTLVPSERLRTKLLTSVSAVVLLGFVAYPWIATPRVSTATTPVVTDKTAESTQQRGGNPSKNRNGQGSGGNGGSAEVKGDGLVTGGAKTKSKSLPVAIPHPPDTVNNCPNGICISGGTVTNPIVNNTNNFSTPPIDPDLDLLRRALATTKECYAFVHALNEIYRNAQEAIVRRGNMPGDTQDNRRSFYVWRMKTADNDVHRLYGSYKKEFIDVSQELTKRIPTMLYQDFADSMTVSCLPFHDAIDEYIMLMLRAGKISQIQANQYALEVYSAQAGQLK